MRMNLTLVALAKSKSIKVILEGGEQTWEEIALNGEEVVKALDKLFKRAKMNVTFLDTIHVLAEDHSSLISICLAKTIKKSLSIAKHFKTFR